MKMMAMVFRLVRSALLATPIALMPAVSSVVLQSFGLKALTSGVVYAAKEKRVEKPKYKTKKSYSLRQSVYKQFARVQEKTDAEDWPGALVVLQGIEKKSQKFTSFEKANLWNYYGWVYYSLGNHKQAIRFYERVLAEEQLSDALRLGTLYTVAQLLFVQEDYRGAIVKLKQWMKIQPIVGAYAYVLLAQGYYQINDMKQSLANVNIAVDKYEKKGKVPKENWYTLQRAVYFDQGNNQKVIDILHKLVRHYPKSSYWKQLSSMYGAEGREKDQLHSLEAVYLMGALTKQTELMNLAYLFMGEDVPYKAARVIEKGIKAGQIEETSKNLEVLATAWRLAQEIQKSIPEMEKAAKKSDKGDLYARLAGIYLDSDQYKKTLKVGAQAIKRGGIKRPDQLNIVLGMANANLKQYKAAIKAFEKAKKDKRSKKFALQWIDFAKNELTREESLKE